MLAIMMMRLQQLRHHKIDARMCVCLRMRSVQHLSLRYNGITAVGARLLGTCLGTLAYQNQKLLSLNLNGNCVGDEGARALAEVSVWSSGRYIRRDGVLDTASCWPVNIVIFAH